MTFLDQSDQQLTDNPRFTIQPCPYESKPTFGEGMKDGPQSILSASQFLEHYDPRTETTPVEHGISQKKPLHSHEAIRNTTIDTHTFPVFLGGDHSITIPIMERQPSQTGAVVFDAHADMRYKYHGDKHNHACVTRHISANHQTTVLGARSYDEDERRAIQSTDDVSMRQDLNVQSIDLPGTVHLSIDVDVLDPAVIHQTGTPEPNGASYSELLQAVQTVFENTTVASADIVEFAPDKGEPSRRRAEAYTVAKLLHQILGIAVVTDNG